MEKENSVYINTTLAGPGKELKIPGFFQIFQDFANLNAQKIGCGSDMTNQLGYLWVITRCMVEFYRMPRYEETVYVDTHPGSKKACFFPRHITVFDEEGAPLIKASSVWVVIDKESRQMVMQPQFPYVDGTLPGDLPLPPKVAPQDCSLVERRKVHISDCDVNGHLNNTRYIEMIVDLHHSDFYAKKALKRLIINYNAEILEGQTVDLLANSDLTYVQGNVDGRICFECALEYQDC